MVRPTLECGGSHFETRTLRREPARPECPRPAEVCPAVRDAISDRSRSRCPGPSSCRRSRIERTPVGARIASSLRRSSSRPGASRAVSRREARATRSSPTKVSSRSKVNTSGHIAYRRRRAGSDSAIIRRLRVRSDVAFEGADRGVPGPGQEHGQVISQGRLSCGFSEEYDQETRDRAVRLYQERRPGMTRRNRC